MHGDGAATCANLQISPNRALSRESADFAKSCSAAHLHAFQNLGPLPVVFFFANQAALIKIVQIRQPLGRGCCWGYCAVCSGWARRSAQMHGVGALVVRHKREESELTGAFGIARRAGLSASRIE